MVPISLNSIDVQHQQRPTVRPVWGSQPPDDPNITSYAADVELQNYLDVDAQEAPLDVGVALHSSTLTSLSSHRIAVLSAKNVQWVGSHRRIKKLESLADRIAAGSAISPDLSPDSAVTPRVILPWFQFDRPPVSRYSRHFYGGGILDQRLPPPHPVYSMQSDPGVLSSLDGYVSDGDNSYRREWFGFKKAPSVRRLLTSPSHCYWHPLPGLPPHRIARILMRIPNVHRNFHQIQSDVLTDDEDGQSCFQLPPDFPYEGRRRCLIRRSCYEGNGQLEWFLGICAGCRAGDEWSQLIYDQEVAQQTREIKDLLKTIQHDEILGPSIRQGLFTV